MAYYVPPSEKVG